ncbi:hypothetical protein GCM10007389_04500 [Pontibacter akesuensis]|nr:hypothetical protein GCM10007389_04500 [Pontibacter akesuensis]
MDMAFLQGNATLAFSQCGIGKAGAASVAQIASTLRGIDTLQGMDSPAIIKGLYFFRLKQER